MESSSPLSPNVLLYLERCTGLSNITVDAALFPLLGIDVDGKTTPEKAYSKAKKRLREVGGDIIEKNAADLKLTVSPAQMLQACLRFGPPEFRNDLARLYSALGKAAYARRADRATPAAAPQVAATLSEGLPEAVDQVLAAVQSTRPTMDNVVGLQKTLDLDPRLRNLFPY